MRHAAVATALVAALQPRARILRATTEGARRVRAYEVPPHLAADRIGGADHGAARFIVAGGVVVGAAAVAGALVSALDCAEVGAEGAGLRRARGVPP